MDGQNIELEDLNLDGVFPELLRSPSPEPTVCTYMRAINPSLHTGSYKEDDGKWSEILVRLVGSHPLWGHYLWNAARAFANYLDRNSEIYQGKNVLELGAGGGLPGMVTALNGSRTTVLTDYPDKDLLENLVHNVERNIPATQRANVFIQGHIWGTPVDDLLEIAPEKYDLIILSDLVFNHSEYDAQLKTCELTLRSKDNHDSDDDVVPTVLVFYTHHRPHLASRELGFFSKAQKRGWICEEIVTERYPPMFPDDPGDEEVRATVHGWALTR